MFPPVNRSENKYFLHVNIDRLLCYVTSTRILAPIPDALWDMRKLSIGTGWNWGSTRGWLLMSPLSHVDPKRGIFRKTSSNTLYCEWQELKEVKNEKKKKKEDDLDRS